MAVLDLRRAIARSSSVRGLQSPGPQVSRPLEINLKRGTFRASPPLELSYPKSEFAIRPGKRIELEDLVAVYYCLLGLSQDLEDKLKFGVTAYRIRKGNPPRVTQGATLILPKSLRRQWRLIFPWYTAWPQFIKRLRQEYARGRN